MDVSETSDRRRIGAAGHTVESRASWVVALTALGIYTVSFGAPTITVVALKPIAAELGSARSVPALAFSLAWFGAAVGGVWMGWLAERTGLPWGGGGRAVSVALGPLGSSLRGEAAPVGRRRGFIGP